MKKELLARIASWVVVLALATGLAVCLTGCDDLAQNSYRTLATLGNTYDAVMRSAGDAHEIGIITDEQRDRVIALANVFYGSYHTARQMLAAYVKAQEQDNATGNPALKTLLEKSLAQAMGNMADLVSYYRRINSGAKEIEEWKQ